MAQYNHMGLWQSGIARGLCVIALTLGLVFIAAACEAPYSVPVESTLSHTAEPESVQVDPTPSSAAEPEDVPDTPTPSHTGEPESVEVDPTPLSAGELNCILETTADSDTPSTEYSASEEAQAGDDDSSVIIMSELPPEFYGAGTASLEERIYDSDVVVRACLLSARNGVLLFRAIEYLKGSWTDVFTVRASTRGRSTEWDDREAVLFLTWGGGPTTQTSEGPVSAFLFTQTAWDYTGQLPEGYMIGTRNPVWLPAASESDTTTSSTDGTSGADPEFIIDLLSPLGAPYPTVTLADLRAKIAWVRGGADIARYDKCIQSALGHLAYYRDWETYHGREWEPYESKIQSARGVVSGAEQGTVIVDHGPSPGERGHYAFWFSGDDAGLFSSLFFDDEVASNGYRRAIATARPLPSGTYRFMSHLRGREDIPCDFRPVNNWRKWTITVTSPSGTVHEAFFDPAALTPGVGFSATSGVLNPTAFSIGGTSTSITGLKWASNAVVMTLSPYVSLSGQTVDLIELDGSVGLSLAASSATANSTAGTLTWTVTEQPWEDGDQLMLRIGTPPPAISLNDVTEP